MAQTVPAPIPPLAGRPSRPKLRARRAPFGSARPRNAILIIPAFCFVVALFVVPIAELAGGAGNGYSHVFSQQFLSGSLPVSVEMAFEVTALCLVLAFPAARLLLSVRSAAVRALLYAIVISPLLTSVIVRTFGWIILLNATGPINRLIVALHLSSAPIRMLYTYPATVVADVQVLLPFSIIPIIGALESLDPNLERAAASFGASAVRRFVDIKVPQLISGAGTAGLIVFSLAMGLYITPLLIGGSGQPIAAIRAYVEAESLFNLPNASALSVVLLGIAAVVTAAAVWRLRKWEKKVRG